MLFRSDRRDKDVKENGPHQAGNAGSDNEHHGREDDDVAPEILAPAEAGKLKRRHAQRAEHQQALAGDNHGHNPHGRASVSRNPCRHANPEDGVCGDGQAAVIGEMVMDQR